MKFWIGDAPTACDICTGATSDVFYDASIPRYRGTWANTCEDCFKLLGCKLGIGYGQRFERMPDGRFLCTAGGTLDYGKAKEGYGHNGSNES